MSLDLDRVKKSARRVSKFAKRNPKRPSTDTVHKLRTSARHLESALVTLALDSKRGVKSLLRDLKKTHRRAGAVRDMDVLTAKALTIDWRGEQDCLVRLLEHLGAERSKRALKLRSAIAKRRRKVRRSLERGLKRVESVAERSREDDDAETVRATIAHALQVTSKLSHPGRLSKNNLHEYRLKVKELRDVLRLSNEAADSALVPKLEEVKDAIGDWHDWVELSDIAAERLDHGSACELSKRIAATRDQKYRHALSLTQGLIADHLRPRVKKASVAPPVLEAVAAIAQDTGPELAH
jgi:CHAD domain-containing protein